MTGSSTLGLLNRLAQKKLMSIEDRNAFAEAYVFLRDVEHKLQMVHDLQTHSLPVEQEELGRCAVRMGYGTDDRKQAAALFQADHHRHTEMVHRTFRSLFVEPMASPLLQATMRVVGTRRSRA